MYMILLMTGSTAPHADELYLGSGGFKSAIRYRQATESARFDITMLERELEPGTLFLLAPSAEGQREGSPMQRFEHLVLQRAIGKRATCGLYVPRLALTGAKHLCAHGDHIRFIIVATDERDTTGGLESNYPHAECLTIASTFEIPRVLHRVFNFDRAAA